MGRMIFRCQAGFELLLEKELRTHGFSPAEMGEGWLRTKEAEGETGAEGGVVNAGEAGRALPEFCFAHAVLLDAVEITGESVNAIAGAIAERFFESARTERFDGAWPLIFETAGGLDGLGRRMSGVEKAFDELLKKKMGRVAKLASPEKPRGIARERGLFVFFADFKRVFVARECVFGGQRRMADDELAPSRSYLKVEEAYVLLGREPDVEETVADLGAAPGGWSYSAAKRRAHVVAVDNGPLKGGALGHALIEHRTEDAFRFEPEQGQRFDWLFCDLVEEPHHVMRNLIEPWITRGWCRRFVVMLKFGRVDAVALLQEITAPGSVLATHTTNLHIRHLYHDREEFTVVGEVKA